MAIIKTGDSLPIINCYDNDGEVMECLKCGNKLIVVVMEGNNNKLVCNICDLSEGLESD